MLVGRYDRGLDPRLFHRLDLHRVGIVGGIVQLHRRAVGHLHLVDDRRCGRDEVEIELALQPLLHDLEMEQTQKATAEAEAQGRAGLGLEMERGVVEAELGERLAQHLELGGIGREETAEDHRDAGLEAGQHLGRGLAVVGDRVAHLAVGDCLYAGDDEADLARSELRHVGGLGCEDADFVEIVGRGGGHHADLHAPAQHAVLHADQRHDAEIRIVPAVDQQRLQRRLAVALGSRQALHHGLEQLVDAEAGLGRDHDRFGRVDADHILDLGAHTLGIG